MAETQEMYEQMRAGLIDENAPSTDRLGVTQEPLIDEIDCLIISPLHAMLRLFDLIIKLIIFLRAGIWKFSDSAKLPSPFFQKG